MNRVSRGRFRNFKTKSLLAAISDQRILDSYKINNNKIFKNLK